MDEIMGMLEKINWKEVFETVKGIVEKIVESGIFDKIFAAVKDLIGGIAG